MSVTGEVLTGVTPVTPPLSLRAYAKHRGTSPTAVHRAIATGRLSKCVIRDAGGKFVGISDPAIADREWTASTDLTKAPASVIVRADARGASSADTEPVDVEPPTEGLTLSLSDALAKEKHWKALSAELDYKQRRGDLVDAKEVEARIVDEYSRVRTKMLGVARKAKARLPHLTRDDITTIDNLIREALEDVASPTDDQAPA